MAPVIVLRSQAMLHPPVLTRLPSRDRYKLGLIGQIQYVCLVVCANGLLHLSLAALMAYFTWLRHCIADSPTISLPADTSARRLAHNGTHHATCHWTCCALLQGGSGTTTASNGEPLSRLASVSRPGLMRMRTSSNLTALTQVCFLLGRAILCRTTCITHIHLSCK